MTDDRLSSPEQMESYAFIAELLIAFVLGAILVYLLMQAAPLLWFAMKG
jgi:hypothetical protein